MKLTIRKKFLILALIVTIILSVGHMIDSSFVKDNFLKEKQELLRKDVHGAHERVMFTIDSYKKDVSLLSKVSPVRGLIKNEPDNLDDLDDSYEERKHDLENFFLSFADSKSIYRDISYFDNFGKEIVRIEKKFENDRSVVIKDNKFKDIKNKNYFVEAKSLEYGSVFVDEFDLHRDGDVITKPYQPILIMSTPVFNEDDINIGVIVVEVLLKELFESIIAIDQDLYLVDKDYYFLFNEHEPEKMWGKQLGKEYFLDELKIHSHTPFYSEDMIFVDHLDEDHFLSFHIINYDSINKDKYWLIGRVVNTESFMSGYEALEGNILIINLTVFALLFLLLLPAISIQFIRPINSLSEAIKNINQGNYNINIKSTTNDEFKDLIENFNFMAKTMYNKDREKYEFITSASHQLKTPVVGVGMQIENLKEKMKDSSCSKYTEDLDDITENNARAIVIVNDLFKVLELGEMYFATNLSNVKFIDLVNIVLVSFDEEIKKNKIKFEVSIPLDLKITVDESRFKEVLLTLIENSIIYSNKNSIIKIGVIQKNNKIEFKITDEGMGIPKKDQIHIFDKFFRSKNSYIKKSVGTGLGLVIAKTIIEGHGGKIWFESEEKKGTTFYFNLPSKGSVTDSFCYEVCSVPKSKVKK